MAYLNSKKPEKIFICEEKVWYRIGNRLKCFFAGSSMHRNGKIVTPEILGKTMKSCKLIPDESTCRANIWIWITNKAFSDKWTNESTQ